jgi:hypothetical protein
MPTTQVALVIGLAEVAKRIGLDKRWIPLVDLALGLSSGCVVYHSYGIVNSIIIGLAIGLSACGLFSGIKNVIGK